MFPAWVRRLDDAERFLRGWVEQFGGEVDPPGGPTFTDLGEASDPARRVWMHPVEVHLAGGVTLTASAVLRQAERSVEVAQYALQLRRGGQLLWRYCRNPYHLDSDGVDTHVHHGDGRREPSPPAPFEFVADLVRVELLD